MDPATLLATTTSIPIDADEMEVANTFHDGELELVRCEGVDMEVPPAEIILEGRILCGVREREGPFVDLTDTYDVVRDEPSYPLKGCTSGMMRCTTPFYRPALSTASSRVYPRSTDIPGR